MTAVEKWTVAGAVAGIVSAAIAFWVFMQPAPTEAIHGGQPSANSLGTVMNKPSEFWATAGATESNSQVSTPVDMEAELRAGIDIGARSFGESGASATPPLTDYNGAANGGKRTFRGGTRSRPGFKTSGHALCTAFD